MSKKIIALSMVLVAAITAVWTLSKRGESIKLASASKEIATATAQTGDSSGPIIQSGVKEAAAGTSMASRSTAATTSPARKPMVFGLSGQVRIEEVPAGRFRNQLARLTPVARANALKKLGDLQIPFNDVNSLGVDRRGFLFYQCDLLPESAGAQAVPGRAGSPQVAGASVSISSPPVRHSKPGASRVIYLDFNGHNVTGTAWNEGMNEPGDPDYEPPVSTFVGKPYDTDGNPATFSDTEQAAIIEVWSRVAEDYAPFDVDVTTEQPAVFTRTVARALITAHIDANGVNMPAPMAGGVAYVNVFNRSDYVSDYSPALVYFDNLAGGTTPSYIAEAVSHEIGHNLGLSHDGTSTLEYYGGHGTGDTSWGPIMGTGYNRNVSQWSKGEYYNADNYEDDLAIIAAYLPFRADDAGNTKETAVSAASNETTISKDGRLERSLDVDFYSFAAGVGPINLSVVPFQAATGTKGGNADLKLELLNEAGNVVASDDPAAGTAAALTYNATGGKYYIRISGVGTGTPQSSAPAGYTSYGSVGQYTLTGTMVRSVLSSPSPVRQVLAPGQALQLSVSSSASGPYTYQWIHNGRPMNSVTGSSYDVSSVRAQDGGWYEVLVTDSSGTHRSPVWYVTVVPAQSYVFAWGNLTGQGAVPAGLSDVVALAAGSSHNLVVRTDGTVTAWGLNNSGQLNVPVGLSNVVAVAAGSVHSVALKADGTLVAWGMNDSGQASIPAGASSVVSIAASNTHTVALKVDGTVVAWGNSGQNVPAGLNDVVSISAASSQSVAVKADGSIVTWGSSGYHSFPTGFGTDIVSATLAAGARILVIKADGTLVTYNYSGDVQANPVTGLSDLVALGASYNHSLALKADGTLVAWGNNSVGQATIPNDLVGVFAIAVGSSHNLALVSNTLPPQIDQQPQDLTVIQNATAMFEVGVRGAVSTIYQWQRLPAGGSLWSNMGNGGSYSGATTSRLVVSGTTLATSGDKFRCVATNSYGSTTTNAATLTVAADGPVRVASGGYYHSLFVTSDNVLWGMGSNFSNQLGVGALTEDLQGPTTPVPIALDVVAVSAGGSHSLYIKTDGTLWGMGSNYYGQLGNGTLVNAPSPIQIATGVIAAAAGFTHSLFIKTDGTLWAMGDNQNGQLGLGVPGRRTSPVQIATGVIAVDATQHSLFLKADGTLWGMGLNFEGQLGRGDRGNAAAPVQIATGVAKIAAAGVHSLFLKTDATLWAMGANDVGQLGDGTSIRRLTPVQVATNVVTIAAAGAHSLFIKSDATLWATGSNWGGQLGDGSGSNQFSPVQVAINVMSVDAGAGHTMFLKTDGTLWVMGDGQYGQLGVGGTSDRFTPVKVTIPALSLIITAHPQSQVASLGGSASFSVAANGAGTLAYQWERQTGSSGNPWVNVSNNAQFFGATTSTLSVTGFTAAMNGDKFRCKVTDSSGNVTSAYAVLTQAANRSPTASFTLSSERTIGATITATVTVGDLDGNYSYANLWVRTPNRGWLTIKADNSVVVSGNLSAANTVAATAGTHVRTFNFTPTDGAGEYTFALAALDTQAARGDAPNQTIMVTAPVNNAPTASFTLSSERTIGSTLSINLDVNDTDGNLSYANLWVRTPNRGWLTIKANNSVVASGNLDAANNSVTGAGSQTRTFAFTPTDGSGNYTFALAAVDTLVARADAPSQTITVINPVNSAPTAAFTLSSERTIGSTLSINLNVNDTDGNLSYANLWVRTPNRGWLTIKADNSAVVSGNLDAAYNSVTGPGAQTRTFAFTPTDGPGNYTFALAAMDTLAARGDASSQTITVTGAGGNNAPTASFTLSSERTIGSTLTATVTVGDVDGDYAYANLWVRTPNRGWVTLKADNSVVVSGNLSAANTVAATVGTYTRTFAFTPTDGVGDYTFSLAALDAAGNRTTTASQVITVTGGGGGNNAPTASFTLSSERTIGSTISVNLNVNDTDGNLSYANLWVRTPNRGWLTIKADNTAVVSGNLDAANNSVTGAGAQTRTFAFTPTDGTGNYTFALAAVDTLAARGDAPSQTITVTGSDGGDNAPTASFTLSSERTIGSTISVSLNVSDLDGDYAYANLWVRSPNRGWLTIKADNSVVVSGNLDAANNSATSTGAQTRTFSFTATDGPGDYTFSLAAVDAAAHRTTTASQVITVTGAGGSNAPTASFTLSSERTIGSTISINLNVGDVDGDYAYSNLWVRTPNRGWLTIKADNSVVVSGNQDAANNSATSTGAQTRTLSFTATDGPGNYTFSLAAVDAAGHRTTTAPQTIAIASSINSPASPAPDTASFVAWRQANFTLAELGDANISGPDAVYGDDGLTNLLKYALGLEPKHDETGALGETSASSTEWTYTYPRPANITDVVYTIEISTDDVHWNSTGVIVEKVSTAVGWELWQAHYPRIVGSPVTFRINVKLR